jgi:peptidyl-prolyl cis-trans isomerase D
VVESEFGFHIIQLTDIKAPAAPSLESMRAQLEADLRDQLAKRQFAESAETFSDSVYVLADTYKPVADQLKLTVQQAQNVTRTPSSSTPMVLADPKLLEALFAQDSVSKQRNTAAVEVNSTTLVSARIVKHRPAAVQPFAEVKDLVRSLYVSEQAVVLAKAEGQKKLTEWQSQPDQAKLGPALVISRDTSPAQPTLLVEAALRANPSQLPALVGVDLGAQGYAVVRVNKLMPRTELNAQQDAQSREQFARLLGNAEAAAYLAHLREQFKVEFLVAKPKAPNGS